MANLLSKKDYDEIKNRMYYVQVFDKSTGRHLRYLSGVNLLQASEYVMEWQKRGCIPILAKHHDMQMAYLTDGTVLTDIDMVVLLLKLVKEKGNVSEQEKVEYLKYHGYTFIDAYTLEPHKGYN